MSLSQALSNVSISGSAPVSTDNAVESFADVNGDGLPDKILAGKNVRLQSRIVLSPNRSDGMLIAFKVARAILTVPEPDMVTDLISKV